MSVGMAASSPCPEADDSAGWASCTEAGSTSGGGGMGAKSDASASAAAGGDESAGFELGVCAGSLMMVSS